MRSRPSFLLPLLFCVGACGGSTVTSTAAGDPADAATAFPFADGGTSDGAGGPTGRISIMSVDDGIVASATFARDGIGRTSAPLRGCTVRGDSAAPAIRETSAGTITLDVPTRDGNQVVEILFDGAEKRYELATFDARVEPGAMLRAWAAGTEDVAAFTAEMRTTPNVVFDAPEILELDARTPRDVTVHWAGDGETNDVGFDLWLGDRSVSCTFAGDEHEGTIPAAMIADVVASAPAECKPGTCNLLLSSGTSRATANGAWTIVLVHANATVKQVDVVR